MNGQGWTFKGRTGQEDPSNRYHKATKDEGEAQGCADINAAQDVQALIAAGSKTHIDPIPCPHFLFVSFLCASKEKQLALQGETKTPTRDLRSSAIVLSGLGDVVS